MEGRFDTFTMVIASLYQNVQKIKMMEMEEFGLRTGHVTCLHYLYANPDGLTLKELTALCALDKAAVSRYLSVLQERGLARIEERESRKYNLKWVLTDAGKQTAEDIDGRIGRAVSAGGDFLTEEERRQFYPWIMQIDRNLRNYVKEMEEKRSRQKEGFSAGDPPLKMKDSGKPDQKK